MKKIVITGGPCGGKTTVIERLKKDFGRGLVFAPEVATQVLNSGFPVPGKDVEWSQEWQDSFQKEVWRRQIEQEEKFITIGKKMGAKAVIFDRGRLDGASYLEGGVSELCEQFQVTEGDCIKHYDVVIHIESLAKVAPELYTKGQAGRFESLSRALEVEEKCKLAWKAHRQRVVVSTSDMTRKVYWVLGIIDYAVVS
jgi:predicted ATPase